MQESVALDTSHESGRGTPHLSSPEPGAEKEEFSDWDSWEDENEVGLNVVVCCSTNLKLQRIGWGIAIIAPVTETKTRHC